MTAMVSVICYCRCLVMMCKTYSSNIYFATIGMHNVEYKYYVEAATNNCCYIPFNFPNTMTNSKFNVTCE